MLNLIITIISIAFFAIILVAGHGYVNFDKINTIRESSRLENALVQLSTANATYLLLNKNNATQMSDLVPDYTAEPTLPEGLTWDSLSFNQMSGETQSCFGGDVSEVVYSAIKSVQTDAGVGSLTIGTACGDTTNIADPATFPATVMITHRIK